MSVTVIYWYAAPTGTVTVSCVLDADVTVAFTAPKYTTFLFEVVLKLVPVIVTVVPMGPEVGEKEVIVGGPPGVGVIPPPAPSKIETVLEYKFVTARSSDPSPLKSADVTEMG